MKADVLIHGDRIVEVGPNLSAEGAKIIDAGGAYVTPGFIDLHTHLDPMLFWNPLTEMADHGVTTVVIGNCSLGLAPVRPEDVDSLSDLFGFVEDIPRDAFDTLVPWGWQSYQQYADAIDAGTYAANIVALVSHSMLRQYVMGAAAWERAATSDEAAKIAAELDAALEAGAMGMSTSHFHLDRQRRCVPSTFASDDEFEQCFAVLGRHRKPLQVVPRQPDPDTVCADLERLAPFAAKYKVAMFSNAIGEMPTMPEFSRRLLACARDLHQRGARMYHMLSPRSMERTINPHSTNSFQPLPSWNDFIQSNFEKKLAMLGDPEWRESARRDWDEIPNFRFPSDQIDKVRIISAPDENRKWVGSSLADLVAARAGHPSDVLADWLLETKCETRFVYPISNLDPARVGELARQPEVLIGAGDAGAHLQQFCGVGDSTLLLTRHVRDRGDLTIELAVHKLTAEPAELLGLSDRGKIAPGAIADLTIFALDELRWEAEFMAEATPPDVERFKRPPGNYRYTILSGIVVQTEGRETGARPAHFVAA